MTSPFIAALNRVKQSGVISPVLFCIGIYIFADNFLVKLSKSVVGCRTLAALMHLPTQMTDDS
jgi:hypothetical protein